jgi:hypothetical protein
MITHTHNWSVSSSSGVSPITGSQSETGSSENPINQQFAAGSTDEPFAVTFTTAGLQDIFLVSNKDMTIKVNSTSSPILTIDLVAGEPFQWNVSDPNRANPFSADVTTFYVTCTPAATLKGNLLRA